MKISGVQTQGVLKYVHQAIYAPLDSDSRIRRSSAAPPESILDSLALRTSSPHVVQAAVRVALIHSRHQGFLKQMEERPDLPEGLRTKLPALKSCMPAGVSLAQKIAPRYCRLYAGCGSRSWSQVHNRWQAVFGSLSGTPGRSGRLSSREMAEIR